ncbi:MAG: bifunctional oligoribonuclease/PAP phosphatase NrnA, partial [Oscillatoriales cyanobacterium]
MKDHQPTNSDEVSDNHEAEVVPSASTPGKRRSKAEVASEDDRASLRGELPDRKVEQLRQMFDRHRGDRQLILLQDFPDPDALSSAWAYKLIAEQYDIQCEIIYAG